jgi:hypothetical protein
MSSNYNKVAPGVPPTQREDFKPNALDIKCSITIEKYNGQKKAWNRRLFILTNTHIAFYKSDDYKFTVPSELIPLKFIENASKHDV